MAARELTKGNGKLYRGAAMTKHAKEKQKRKNAQKDAQRAHLTIADAQRIKADLRRQEAEANARLAEQCAAMEDEWDSWVAWHNAYTIPRICAGFYLAALKAAKKTIDQICAGRFYVRTWRRHANGD